ncbi:uncharacterized protein ASPGLDRAFT_861048 [Aspergillus glaucus CBS 516.65]|uniref:Uncharacterized protein n=1 Tax=Aspergillus glaucus CBS 516.65 TaxID=1160497 RepID=A0A1L9V8P1_ASPGL|nr:hypothetical protein ASPGLDRAFT_861048 [Aspergillus glaucus CBS 516.65]OJJ80307.1 hypothetical protein ASPGLDRAFT_861048 [Aspergillus glaucus CBS 516.65]
MHSPPPTPIHPSKEKISASRMRSDPWLDNWFPLSRPLFLFSLNHVVVDVSIRQGSLEKSEFSMVVIGPQHSGPRRPNIFLVERYGIHSVYVLEGRASQCFASNISQL